MILQLKNVESAYGLSQILFGVILGVTRGVSGHEERYSQ